MLHSCNYIVFLLYAISISAIKKCIDFFSVTFSMREFVVHAADGTNHTSITRKSVEMLRTRLYDLQNGSRISVLDAEDSIDLADDVRTIIMASLKVSFILRVIQLKRMWGEEEEFLDMSRGSLIVTSLKKTCMLVFFFRPWWMMLIWKLTKLPIS